MTRRGPLILALAVARLSGADGGAPRPAPRNGHVVSTMPEDGALLVETGRGRAILVLASETVVRDGRGSTMGLEDLSAGDQVEWRADRHDGIVVVDEVTRLESFANAT